jgi:hypothetical protein
MKSNKLPRMVWLSSLFPRIGNACTRQVSICCICLNKPIRPRYTVALQSRVSVRFEMGMQKKIKFFICSLELTSVGSFPPTTDRLCGLVVRVPGYRSGGTGFDSRRCHIFWVVNNNLKLHTSQPSSLRLNTAAKTSHRCQISLKQ